MPDPKFLEDIKPGTTEEFGSIAVSAEEIIDFARKFDPQSFHLDAEDAKRSVFGGLAASGWHTASIMMRMLVDHVISPETSLGSPGVDELRWTKPVRPGDVLSIRVTVLETVRSKSKPDRGIIRSFVEVINQSGDVVMSLKTMGLCRCRSSHSG